MSDIDSLRGDSAASESWQELARSSARGTENASPELLLEVLTLRLAGGAYGIPVERVREIVRLRPVTPVPHVPRAIIGALALRGEIVQVVDMRVRLGLEEREATRDSRLIILHGDDERATALLVDAVREVMHVAEESLRPTHAASGAFVSELAVRGTEFVSLIDVERVLNFDAV